MYMFYAGAYNNNPQQIGVAKSKDGIHWEKMSNKPFLSNGDRDTWNYCESGHPHIFRAPARPFCFFREMMIMERVGCCRIKEFGGMKEFPV